MSKPYVYTDPEGDFLAVSQCKLGVHVSVRPAGDGMGSFAACIRPGDVRKVTTAMHEAAGLPDRWAELADWLGTTADEAAEDARAWGAQIGSARQVRAETLGQVRARMDEIERGL